MVLSVILTCIFYGFEYKVCISEDFIGSVSN